MADKWSYHPVQPIDGTDARKLVTLLDCGMVWVGIRAYDRANKRWLNNNEPEKARIVAWRDLAEPARGFWQGGRFYLTDRHP